jgi:hypothetical protein
MPIRHQSCSIPSGNIYIGPYGGLKQAALPAGAAYPQMNLTTNDHAGVVEKTDIKYKLAEKPLTNSNSRAGGVACVSYWVEDCTVTMAIRTLRTSLLPIFLLGRNSFTASGAVTNEEKVIEKNAVNAIAPNGSVYVPLNRIPDWAVAPVVTNLAGSTTYVLGTDYTLGESGILIPPSSTIVNAVGPFSVATVRVSYTALDTLRTDALVTTPQDVSIWCDGFDRASGAQTQTHIYYAKGMVDGMPLISDDHVNLNATFRVLEDTRIPFNASAPVSRYFHQLRG